MATGRLWHLVFHLTRYFHASVGAWAGCVGMGNVRRCCGNVDAALVS